MSLPETLRSPALASPERPRLGPILVDLSHCGRHVTGLERIALELFSPEALAPLPLRAVRASGRAEMMWRQAVSIPTAAWLDRSTLVLCPGFPPSFATTLLGWRVLPYIHDLFLITRQTDLNPRARLAMAPPFRFAVGRLPRFLVNSRSTADELARFARPDAEIELYRPRVRNVFGLEPGDRNSRPAHPGHLRLVAVGTVEPRKNLRAAAAILSALRAGAFPDATLDIVGRVGWGTDEALLRGTTGVTVHGYQDAEAARRLIEGADALISTSHDEGLGLPLLEAQFAGLAVIAPDKPVFREVLGRSGLLIDPLRPQAAADLITALAAEPGWRGRHAAEAAQNLSRWNLAAEGDRDRVVALIERLAARAAQA